MKLGSALLREKTNVGVKTSTTFNAPGVYIPPYGKTTVRIAGRGASGNQPSGGNYAGETQSGSNPTYYQRIVYQVANFGAPGAGPHPAPTTSTNVGPVWTYTTAPSSTSGNSSPDGNYTLNVTTYWNDTNLIATGTANFSPQFNTFFPGNAGQPTNIGGVYFLAGNAGSLAPVVPTTTTNISYTAQGLSITVPTGGYVTIDNI